VTTESKERAPRCAVFNAADYDDELKPGPEKKPLDKSMIVKLSAGDPSFGGVSVEDVLSKTFGSDAKYWDYYKSTGVLRKCINMVANFTTRAGFETTISCINKNDDPEKEEYQAVKRKVDELNRLVNLDEVLRITQIKRQIYGNAGWQVVGPSFLKIKKLIPLHSAYIYPQVDKKTGDFTHINYAYVKGGIIKTDRLLYFTVDQIENSISALNGVSAIRSIERNIKIKKNLERDQLYAARSLWAPIVIYQADMRGLTPAEQTALKNDLKQDLRPGAIVVTNRQVDASVTQYNPDMNNLIRAIEKQDEEIIGNFGIPKALLSREKTMARATLEFSIRAFYESTIAAEQMYLKRQLERQWYDKIVEELGYADKIRIRHEWKPILDPESQLIVALTRAYDSGVITGDEFFRRLGWELDRVPGQSQEEEPPTEEEEQNE